MAQNLEINMNFHMSGILAMCFLCIVSIIFNFGAKILALSLMLTDTIRPVIIKCSKFFIKSHLRPPERPLCSGWLRWSLYPPLHLCRCLADLFQRIFCLALSIPVPLDFNLSFGISFNWYLHRLIKPRFWFPLGASGGPFPLINLSGITHSNISRSYSLIWNRFHLVPTPINQTHFFQVFGGPWGGCPADRTRQTLSFANVN